MVCLHDLNYNQCISYGLESLSQLFFNQSCIPYSQVHIKDYPVYRHRGLLLDVGWVYALVIVHLVFGIIIYYSIIGEELPLKN